MTRCSRELSLFGILVLLMLGIPLVAGSGWSCLHGQSETLSGEKTESLSDTAPGRGVYEKYCVGCHGVNGDGEGIAAPFLDPKPRDFTKAIFKFTATPAGALPRNADLMRTISKGLPGSSMPNFILVPEIERHQVVEYIKTFSSRWGEELPGTPIAMTEDPFAFDIEYSEEYLEEALARGEEIYHGLTTCWECHPAYVSREEIVVYLERWNKVGVEFRDDLESPVLKKDDWGNPLMPTDFRIDRLKTGSSLESLYEVISAGIGGTAMPTWKGSVQDNDLWAMSYYIKSVIDSGRTKTDGSRRGADR